MNYSEAEAYASHYGDAFYVYDEARFIKNYRALLTAFKSHYVNTRIAYSYKTNYTPAICKKIDALGGYAEVVSEMEYTLARRLGVSAHRIVYNGPWKSDRSLREALIAGSLVNLDSDRDLALLTQIAVEAPSIEMRVGIRSNFVLDEHPDSRFGFDIEGEGFARALVAVKRLPNVKLAGLHCHFPYRSLRSFVARANRMVALASEIFPAPPEFISIGGGFFGEMPDSLKARYPEGIPEFADYAHAVAQTFASTYGNSPESPILFVEPGTALVADTFSFVAKVVDVKQIRGKYLACVAGSIFNISPYSRAQNLPVSVLHANASSPIATADGEYDIVGYTCIEGDVLSKGMKTSISTGDFVVFGNVGSYSIVMKPPFILPSVPIVMRPEDGSESKLVKRTETVEYLFQNFVF
jgi:diaminopimelate decarboxylase